MENNTNDQKTEPEIPESNPGLRARFFKSSVAAAITLVAAACICITIALAISPGAETGISADNSTQTDQPVLYEEPLEGNLDDLVKQVDLALIRTLKKSGVAMRDLKLEDVSLKKYKGQDFHFQQLRFPCRENPDEFIAGIRNGVVSAAVNASLHEASSDSWLITINGIPTHKFFLFVPLPEQVAAAVRPDPNAPKMAIVIDDMGENMKLAQGLAELDIHITFSIWPNSSHVAETINIARKHGNEIMIHLPMQPKGYPRINPGSDALLLGMSPAQISRTVMAAVKNVPGAHGLNNHMGSRFTEDYQGMKQVMQLLKKEKLFFLDSRTTPKSMGSRAASEAGVTFYERNIFLDNVKDVAAIKYQLSKAAQIARKKGQAIAIGHPHRETLKAIRKWAAENRGKINVVPVEELKPAG